MQTQDENMRNPTQTQAKNNHNKDKRKQNQAKTWANASENQLK